MARARIAALAAVLVVLLLSGAPPEVPPFAGVPVAAVAWPPSTTLLVAEVVTGGASASDEYVELANVSGSTLDLAGLEVAYATSSGATVTKKAGWSASQLLPPGRHLLIANALGAYAAAADVTYSGGLAATGGAIVLRPAGGTPIDAVAWGDAANAFVEGTAATAPAAGSSIERRAGAAADGLVDTNDNAVDLLVNATPVAQGLTSTPGPGGSPTPTPGASATPPATATPVPTPVPTPTPTPTPTSTPAPTPTPTASPTPAPSPTPSPTPVPTVTPTVAPTPTPIPSLAPTPVPTPSPTPVPTPTPTPVPTPTPTPSPTPAPSVTPSVAPSPDPTPTPAPTGTPSPAPTGTPSPSPSSTASPSPEPSQVPPITIEAARALPDDAQVLVEGTLTTALGALESARSGFLQDGTAGIALYLDAAFADPIPAGTSIRVRGTLDSRFSQRTLRAAGGAVEITGSAPLPVALEISTGAAAEPLEGLRLELRGAVTEAPSVLSDGLGITIDDGTGPVRVIASPGALGALEPARGMLVTARGPLGQRDSSGTGAAGYRLHATLPGELELEAAPTPTPSPSPAPTATPAPSASPTPSTGPSAPPSPVPSPSTSPTPPPSASPSPTPSDEVTSIADARQLPVERRVTVRGVVVAEAGRLGTPPLLVIADETGGIAVRLPEGVPAPARGVLLQVSGSMSEPYGQRELRPSSAGVTVAGTGPLPVALAVTAGQAGEATEGRLVVVRGTLASAASKATSGDLTFTVTGTDGATLRIQADASANLDPAALKKGVTATFTGIVGQRASRKGALDGYRLWVRDRADIARTSSPGATPSPGASGTPSPSAGGASAVTTIATARRRDGAKATVEGVLTVDRTLLDASGRRTIVQDATGAIEAYLPQPDTRLRAGVRVRLTGTVGTAWGAPRLKVTDVTVLGTGTARIRSLSSAPTAAVEWSLVRATGTLTDVRRSGDRWSADLRLARGASVLVSGLAGSGISAAAVVEGRAATVTGIVKRPYPTATDRRFAIVPRRGVDITLGAAGPAGSPAAGTSGAGTGPAASAGGPGGGTTALDQLAAVPDADLRDLASLIGTRVRVGGLVTELLADGFALDDGTATGRVVLGDGAASMLELLAPGDALNATGIPEERDGAILLVVAEAADIELVGALAGADPSDEPDAPAPSGDASRGDALQASLGRGMGLDPASAGIGTLVLVTLLSVAVTLARRHRGQRALRARILARLDAIAGPPPAAAPATTGPVAMPAHGSAGGGHADPSG